MMAYALASLMILTLWLLWLEREKPTAGPTRYQRRLRKIGWQRILKAREKQAMQMQIQWMVDNIDIDRRPLACQITAE